MNHAPQAAQDDETRTYRGPSVEALLPKIRAELGADAIVTKQRTGLVGGVAGFFQKTCVEIEARRAPRSALGAGILAGDDDEIVLAAMGRRPGPDDFVAGIEDPSLPDPLASPLPFTTATPTFAPSATTTRAAPAYAPPARAVTAYAPPVVAAPAAAPPPVAPEPVEDPFASVLKDASGALILPQAPAVPEPRAEAPLPVPGHPAPLPVPAAAPEPQHGPVVIPVPPQAAGTEAALVEHGLDPAIAADIVGRVTAHAVPFASPRRMKSLVRSALARAVPIAEPPAGAGRTVAFVGPRGAGKSLCAERLAGAYAAAGHAATTLVDLTDAGAAVATAPEGAVVVVDTPGTRARDAAAVAALGAELRAAGVQEVHLVLPSTVGLAAAEELLATHLALAPTALVVSHADATTQLGALVSLAMRHDLPISFLSHDPSEPEGLVPADAASLAGGLLP